MTMITRAMRITKISRVDFWYSSSQSHGGDRLLNGFMNAAVEVHTEWIRALTGEGRVTITYLVCVCVCVCVCVKFYVM